MVPPRGSIGPFSGLCVVDAKDLIQRGAETSPILVPGGMPGHYFVDAYASLSPLSLWRI